MTQLASARREGFSLIELMVALIILGGVLLSTAEYFRRFSRTNADTSVSNTALDLSTARLEDIKVDRNYLTLGSYIATETNLSCLPAAGAGCFTRVTQGVRTNNATNDHWHFTVTVTHPRMSKPVVKTTAIARF
ncbi:MAG: type IV pilus modification PilV family protein [Gemmatimonadaceae bacterium]